MGCICDSAKGISVEEASQVYKRIAYGEAREKFKLLTAEQLGTETARSFQLAACVHKLSRQCAVDKFGRR